MTERKSKKGDIIRCPHCGGSDVRFDEKIGKLQCCNCRNVFESELANERDDVSLLKGEVVGRGARKIIDDEVMLTLKCSSCGAEVSVNTDEALNVRCPWCRHILSIQEKIPNGAVPDMILPFKITTEEAFDAMAKYISEHKMLSKEEFISQFSKSNVIGVYLPYMVVDMNVHAKMSGDGEREVRRYTVGCGDDAEDRFDVDVYKVDREFDLEVDDLTIEASNDKLDQNLKDNTNNVINAIMPFDTENAVEWDARYVRGYVFERRDINVDDLDDTVKSQVEDIMRYQMLDTLASFGRGVRWDEMRLEQKGVKWKVAYMPVWLYSYYDKRKDGKTKLHYVAVNGRTGESAGSSPINTPKVVKMIFGVPIGLLSISLIAGILGIIFGNTVLSTLFFSGIMISAELSFAWMFITGIIIGISVIKYQNKSVRHLHEEETRAAIKNLKASDELKEHLHGVSSSFMYDRNDIKLKGIQQKNAGLFMRRTVRRSRKRPIIPEN